MDSKGFLVEFGKLLKKQRKSLSLSQVNAADQMKIDYRHYQNIEGGKINLRLDTFMKLIEFYKIRSGDEMSVGSLLGFVESPNSESNTDWDLLHQFYVRNNKAGSGSVDKDFRIKDANSFLCHLTGWKKEDGQSFFETALSAENQARFVRACQIGFQQKDQKPFKIDFIKRSKTHITHETFLCVPQYDFSSKGEQSVGKFIFLNEKNLLEEGGRFTNLIQHFRTYFSEVPQLVANPSQMWATALPSYRVQG